MKWAFAGAAILAATVLVYGSLVYAALEARNGQPPPPPMPLELAAPEQQPAPPGDLVVSFENFRNELLTEDMVSPERQREAGAGPVHTLVENVGRPILACTLFDGCPSALAPNDVSMPNTIWAAMDGVAEFAVREGVIPFSPAPEPPPEPAHAMTKPARGRSAVLVSNLRD